MSSPTTSPPSTSAITPNPPLVIETENLFSIDLTIQQTKLSAILNQLNNRINQIQVQSKKHTDSLSTITLNLNDTQSRLNRFEEFCVNGLRLSAIDMKNLKESLKDQLSEKWAESQGLNDKRGGQKTSSSINNDLQDQIKQYTSETKELKRRVTQLHRSSVRQSEEINKKVNGHVKKYSNFRDSIHEEIEEKFKEIKEKFEEENQQLINQRISKLMNNSGGGYNYNGYDDNGNKRTSINGMIMNQEFLDGENNGGMVNCYYHEYENPTESQLQSQSGNTNPNINLGTYNTEMSLKPDKSDPQIHDTMDQANTLANTGGMMVLKGIGERPNTKKKNYHHNGQNSGANSGQNGPMNDYQKRKYDKRVTYGQKNNRNDLQLQQHQQQLQQQQKRQQQKYQQQQVTFIKQFVKNQFSVVREEFNQSIELKISEFNTNIQAIMVSEDKNSQSSQVLKKKYEEIKENVSVMSEKLSDFRNESNNMKGTLYDMSEKYKQMTKKLITNETEQQQNKLLIEELTKKINDQMVEAEQQEIRKFKQIQNLRKQQQQRQQNEQNVNPGGGKSRNGYGHGSASLMMTQISSLGQNGLVLDDNILLQRLNSLSERMVKVEEKTRFLGSSSGSLGKIESATNIKNGNGKGSSSTTSSYDMLSSLMKKQIQKTNEQLNKTNDRIMGLKKNLTKIESQHNLIPQKLQKLEIKINNVNELQQDRLLELIKQLINRVLVDPFNNHFTNTLKKQIHVKFLEIKHEYTSIWKDIENKVIDRAEMAQVEKLKGDLETMGLELKAIVNKKVIFYCDTVYLQADNEDFKKGLKYLEGKLKDVYGYLKNLESEGGLANGDEQSGMTAGGKYHSSNTSPRKYYLGKR